MRHSYSLFPVVLLGIIPGSAFAEWQLQTPAEVVLDGQLERSQILVSKKETSEDLTNLVEYVSENPSIASVSKEGQILSLGDGATRIAIRHEGQEAFVAVQVKNAATGARADFLKDVIPILAKAGCNTGACHASQHGKGGFVLSVFGFDPAADRAAIVRDRLQRRINFVEPGESLLLRKPTMRLPHGGGQRLSTKSIDYQLLVRWIEQGAPGPLKDAPKVTQVTVQPSERVGQQGMSQQLRVVATYSDGSTRDVTSWAKYDTMDDSLVAVTPQGRWTTKGRGQAPVMVRYEGHAGICMVSVPFAETQEIAGWQDRNLIDMHASKKFRELGISPAGVCDDNTFVRRAYLDAVGSLPTPREIEQFLQSTAPNKRELLIDQLLGLTGNPQLDIYNDRYSAYWTLKWSDLIRTNSNDLGPQGMWALHNWIKGSFRENKRYDYFVKELIAAQGSIYSNGPANYYLLANNPADLAESTAQVFLGTRLQCAKCHHHPFEKYSQDDYYGFAAFFSRVGNKTSQEFGLFGGERVVIVRTNGEVTHPRTGQKMVPTPLEGSPVEEKGDRRLALAKWLTAQENRSFARSVVNRYLGYLLGRGLVEPIDDMRATNPPSNVGMMEALTDEFIASGYDLKKLVRTIMNSRLYQLESRPTKENVADVRFYSTYKVKRMGAEVLLDAIDEVCGTRTKYRDLPLGTRAIELPDAEYPDTFLNTFAKPKRVSVCECERNPDENLAQALHMLNGDIVPSKIADPKGRLSRMLAENKPVEEIVTEFYIAALSRKPSQAEMEFAQEFVKQSANPKEGLEDLVWGIINSKEFLYIH